MTELTDTLQRMLQAEREARRIVDEGEKQARQRLDEALRQASEKIAAAREEARARSAEVIARAVAEARAEKQRKVEAVRQELLSFPAKVPEDRMREAVGLIVNAILRDEVPPGNASPERR